jgi:phage gp37-like protein
VESSGEKVEQAVDNNTPAIWVHWWATCE